MNIGNSTIIKFVSNKCFQIFKRKKIVIMGINLSQYNNQKEISQWDAIFT